MKYGRQLKLLMGSAAVIVWYILDRTWEKRTFKQQFSNMAGLLDNDNSRIRLLLKSPKIF